MKKLALIAAHVAVMAFISCGCSPSRGGIVAPGTSPPLSRADAPRYPFADITAESVADSLSTLDITTKLPVTPELLDYIEAERHGFIAAVSSALENGVYDDSIFYMITGKTLCAWSALYNNDNCILVDAVEDGVVTLAFAGDVNLADDWYNMMYAKRRGLSGASDMFGESLLSRMRGADILLVNNEFSYSERGDALRGKQYTFRSSPSNAALLSDAGVDIVSLANNHCFDYGADAFADTLAALESAGIPYVGAGADIGEASEPRYYIAGGVRIAIVAATRAEKTIFSPEATEESSGVLRTYDSKNFCEVIRRAKAVSDYVIAYVHWGTENSTVLESAQLEQSAEYAAAGADAIIGAHTHCLQGVGYADGVPVAYSLGNFWFNLDTLDTAFLEVRIEGLGAPEFTFVPCVQSRAVTSDVSGTAAGKRILSHLKALSPDVDIDESGKMTAKTIYNS